MSETLVDVVAAAARVCPPGQAPSKPQKPAESPDAVRNTQAGADCPLGHLNTLTARFCADCGLPMTEVVLTQRVDLDAVRAAMGSNGPEDKAAKDRQHAEALRANAEAERQYQDISQVADPSERKILIHFVEDGFTWKKVWLRGEMLELGPDHPWWESAQSWIRLSKTEQYQRYGRVFFDFGPYPGRQAAPGTEVPLSNAPAALWAEARGALPARASSDGDGSLVPW
jgi:hypothetical protein